MPLSMNEIGFEVCQPTEADARQIMLWRNDSVTLAMSYHHEPKIWEKFWPEYRETYFTNPPALSPVFAVRNKARIGFLRFDIMPALPQTEQIQTVEISVNVAPDMRGKGFGAKILRACTAYLKEKNIQRIYAEVLISNEVSLKAFLSAGFSPLEQKEKYLADTGLSYPIQTFFFE